MVNTTKLNFWVDSVIGIAFVLSLSSGLVSRPIHGEMEFHVFTSLTMVIGVAIHLVLHRKWIAAAVRPGRKPTTLTANLWLNVLLGASCCVAFISGVSGHHAPGSSTLHAAAAISMIVVLLVHLLRHWKWIAMTAQRYGMRHRPD